MTNLHDPAHESQPEPADDEVIHVNETPVLAQAIITLTEQEGNPGGFTIGLKLASHDDTGENETFRIPVVDIVTLAVVGLLQEVPPEFKARIDQVNSAVGKLGEDLAAGVEGSEAINAFNTVVGVPAYVGA